MRVGRLHVVHRGVYAVGHGALAEHGRLLAAVLALGDGAVLSHISAAMLWGFWQPDQDDGVDVTVARRLRQRPGIRVHAVRALDPGDITRRARISVTVPARTLLDLADVVRSDRALRRSVHEAEVQRRVSHRQLQEQLDRAAGRRGASRLSKLIAVGPAPTRSELEDRTLELMRRHGFPRPETNVRLATMAGPVEVDFHFPDCGLVVETDGDAYHGTRLAREADARKQALLEAAGYRVIRLLWSEVTREQEQTVVRLRRALIAASTT